ISFTRLTAAQLRRRRPPQDALVTRSSNLSWGARLRRRAHWTGGHLQQTIPLPSSRRHDNLPDSAAPRDLDATCTSQLRADRRSQETYTHASSFCGAHVLDRPATQRAQTCPTHHPSTCPSRLHERASVDRGRESGVNGLGLLVLLSVGFVAAVGL